MPADASIFSQYLQPVRSAQDYGADIDKRNLLALQLQGQQGQNALLQLTRQQQADTAQAAMADQQAIRAAAAASGGDRGRFLAALEGTGQPGVITYAQGIRKSDADLEHVQSQTAAQKATAGKTSNETERARRNQSVQDALAFSSPDEAIASINDAVSGGKMPMQAALAMQRAIKSDPNWRANLVTGIVDPQHLKEWLLPHLQSTNLGATTVQQSIDPITGIPKITGTMANTQDPNSIASNATTRYTAGLTDARERSKVKYETDGNGNLVSLPEIAPAGGIVKAGAVTAPGPGMVPLPGKDSTLNDSQAKSYLFGDRMRAADQIIADMAGKGVNREGMMYSGATSLPLVGGSLQAPANATQSPEQQRVLQAKRDFMTAALRRESGASIAPSEFDTFDKTYFPQINDDTKVILDKAALRKRAIDGVLVEVPKNKRPGASSGSTASGAADPADPLGLRGK
jgi:hypothetical protein